MRDENKALYDNPLQKGSIMEKFLNNLKRQAEESPMIAIGVGIGVLTAASKFLDAAGKAQGRRTWKKEVQRRDRMSHRK